MNGGNGIIITDGKLCNDSSSSGLIVIKKRDMSSQCLYGTGKKCSNDFKKVKVNPNMFPNDCVNREWCKGKTNFKNGTALTTNREIDKILILWSKINFDKDENDPNRINVGIKYLYTMPIQMIDFAGTDKFSPTELGELDMVKDVIQKGYKTFAVILNTDVRTGGGIHWFPLFCDFRTDPYTVEYFNSSGKHPRPQVNDWIVKTVNRINSFKERGGESTNRIIRRVKRVILEGLQHQQSETECGLYSLYYIYNRLQGVPVEAFVGMKGGRRVIKDREMTTFRCVLFTSN